MVQNAYEVVVLVPRPRGTLAAIHPSLLSARPPSRMTEVPAREIAQTRILAPTCGPGCLRSGRAGCLSWTSDTGGQERSMAAGETGERNPYLSSVSLLERQKELRAGRPDVLAEEEHRLRV